MAWIKLDESLPDNPKVIKVAAALRLDKDAVAGKLIRFWTWALNNREEGMLQKQDAGTLAEVMRYEGKPGRLVKALVSANLLLEVEGGWRIHDWSEYAGNYVEKRMQAAERKQRQRQNLQEGAAQQPLNSAVTAQGQPRDTAVTRPGQARDKSVTVTPLDVDVDIDIDIDIDAEGDADVDADVDSDLGYGTAAATRAPSGVFGAKCKDGIARIDGNGELRGIAAAREPPNSEYPSLVASYARNVRMPSAIEAQKLREWQKLLPAAVIDYAIEQGALSAVRSWRGVETILLRWRSLGVKTLQAAMDAQLEWQSRREKPAPLRPLPPRGAVNSALTNLDALMAQTLEEERLGNCENYGLFGEN